MGTQNYLNGLFQSNDGDLSSKRVFGAVCIVAGIALMYLGGLLELPTAIDAGKPLLYVGSGLLGVGVAERFKKK